MYKSQQGFLFIMGLFVLSVLTTFTAVGLTRSLTELRIVSYSADSARAFQLAEANLDSAIQAYRTSGPAAFTTAPWTTVGTVSSRPVDGLNIAGASGTVTVSDPASGQPTLDATVTVGGAVRRLYVVGRTTLPTFSHAFFAGKYLQIGSWGDYPVTTDSYDSRLGSYNQDLGGGVFNQGLNGAIGTNGGTSDSPYPGYGGIDLQLQKVARINGDVTITRWIDTNTSTPPGQIGIQTSGFFCNGVPCSALCNGVVCNRSTFKQKPQFDLPPIQIPTALTAIDCTTPESIPTVTSGSRTLQDGHCYGTIVVKGPLGVVDIPGGNVSIQAIAIQGDGKIIMHDDSHLYLRGDRTNSNIVNITNTYDADGTEHGGSLITGRANTIYGEYGIFWVQSKNGIIPNGDPRLTPQDLIIRVVGTNSEPVLKSGANALRQPSFKGSLYVQRGWLWVKGNYYCPSPTSICYWTPAENYGAIVAGEYMEPATHKNPAGAPPDDPLTFHYDESLNGVSLTGAPYFFTIVAWRELAPGEAP